MILSSRRNTKTFGSKSNGKLSGNLSKPIKKGKYILHLTSILPTDSNNKIYKLGSLLHFTIKIGQLY